MLGGEAIHSRLDSAHNPRRHKDHEQGEGRCFDHENAQVQPLQPAPRSQAGHNRQQHHPQNVIEDGRAHDDPGSARRHHMQVAQHARGNSHAGGHHGRAHENGFTGGIAPPLHVSESQNEGGHDPGHGHQQRLAPHPDQVLRAGLEAGAEQNKDRADFRDGMDSVTGVDPAQGKWAERRPGQDLAQDRRQPHPLKQLAHHLRGNEDGKKLQQKLVGTMRHDVQASIREADHVRKKPMRRAASSSVLERQGGDCPECAQLS